MNTLMTHRKALIIALSYLNCFLILSLSLLGIVTCQDLENDECLQKTLKGYALSLPRFWGTKYAKIQRGVCAKWNPILRSFANIISTEHKSSKNWFLF